MPVVIFGFPNPFYATLRNHEWQTCNLPILHLNIVSCHKRDDVDVKVCLMVVAMPSLFL